MHKGWAGTLDQLADYLEKSELLRAGTTACPSCAAALPRMGVELPARGQHRDR